MRLSLFCLIILISSSVVTVHADSQSTMVQVRFTIDTPQGTFTDALLYTQAAFAAVTQKDIDTAIIARKDAWVFAITHPVPPPVYTKDELQGQADDIDKQVLTLAAIKQKILDALSKASTPKGVIVK